LPLLQSRPRSLRAVALGAALVVLVAVAAAPAHAAWFPGTVVDGPSSSIVEVDGLDLLRFDAEGKVRELTVMVRPMSGLNALAEAMGREFERLGIAPPAGAAARSAAE